MKTKQKPLHPRPQPQTQPQIQPHPLLPDEGMPHEPHVLIKLTRQGNLVMELPGLNGSRRLIPVGDLYPQNRKARQVADLPPEPLEETIVRTLNGQLEGRVLIGQSGAPLEMGELTGNEQLWCWTHHENPDQHKRHCRFCRERTRKVRPSKRTWQALGDGSAKVRIIPSQSRKINQSHSKKQARSQRQAKTSQAILAAMPQDKLAALMSLGPITPNMWSKGD